MANKTDNYNRSEKLSSKNLGGFLFQIALNVLLHCRINLIKSKLTTCASWRWFMQERVRNPVKGAYARELSGVIKIMTLMHLF
jgi:hypothetical protein